MATPSTGRRLHNRQGGFCGFCFFCHAPVSVRSAHRCHLVSFTQELAMLNGFRSSFVFALVAVCTLSASCGGTEGQSPPDAQALPAPRPALRIEPVVSTEKADNVDVFCPPATLLVGGGCECGKTAQYVWKAMTIVGKEGDPCECLPLDGDPNGRLAIAHASCRTSPESTSDLLQ